MSACYKLTASCSEREVYATSFLQKVEELVVTQESGGLVAAYFRSPLRLQALQTKTSVMKRNLGLTTARVQELAEESWLTARATTTPREEPSSSRAAPPDGPSVVAHRTRFQDVMGACPYCRTLSGAWFSPSSRCSGGPALRRSTCS